MYCGHFGFSEKPFDMTPDPKYLYLNPNNKEVFAALIYGIRDRRGFISIVGEVGTGKTTLINAALDQLDEKTKAAYIFNTSVTFEELLTKVLFELGLQKSDESLSKSRAIDRLNNFAIEQLTAGGNVALIIDEAQNLDMHSLENLRLLSNLETRKHKLIQLVIAGQPELDAILRQQELRQLTQRINLRRYLIPLSEKETNDYIRHRLAVADYKGSPLFDRRAQKLIWKYSHGIPRKINILCDNALLTGYGVKKKRITTSLMEEAIKDLTWIPFAPSAAPSDQVATHTIDKRRRVATRPALRRWPLAAGLAFVAVIIFGLGLILGRSGLSWRENISLLSKRVFQSQKISQGGGAGGTPTTALPGDDVKTSMNQAVDAARLPAEKVEDESAPAMDVTTAPGPAVKAEAKPVPAVAVKDAGVPTKRIEDEPAPAMDVTTAPGPAEKTEAKPVPAVAVKDAGVPTETIEDEPAPAKKAKDEAAPLTAVTTTSVPTEAVKDEPHPPLEITPVTRPAEEVAAARIPAEELEASRVSTEDVVTADGPAQEVGPESTAATTQVKILPESIGTTEETRKEGAPFTQEETTEQPDSSQSLELPEQRPLLERSIRPGDTLSGIITQHYGSYNRKTLSAVLHENPEIQNPDRIFAGETLKLPRSSENP